MWKHMSCPYILTFNGVFCHNEAPAIVTPWIAHGNISGYLEKHADADRLRLVSLITPRAPNFNLIQTLSHVAFRRGQGGQVPPQLQRYARGHQRGKPASFCEGFERETTSFLSRTYPYFELHPTPGHTRRLWPRPHCNVLGERAKRRTRHDVLHGSRAPPPGKIRSRQGCSIQRGRYLRSGDDSVPGIDRSMSFLSEEPSSGCICCDLW